MAAATRLSQQHSCSLDHLVGDGEERSRNSEAKQGSNRAAIDAAHMAQTQSGVAWAAQSFRAPTWGPTTSLSRLHIRSRLEREGHVCEPVWM
jgi:hypothetical protein